MYLAVASLLSGSSVASAQAVAGPEYRGALPARILGPRKLAAVAEGDLYVADARGRLHWVTRRGELAATVLQGVTSLASAPGLVLAGLEGGAIAEIHPRTGRVLRRIPLGTSEGPSALAYDAVRGKLWMTFASGTIQARALDGRLLHEIAPTGTGVYRLAGVTVDGFGRVWALQDRTSSEGTLRVYDGGSAAFLGAVPAPVRIAGGIAMGAGGQVVISDLFSGNVKTIGADGTALQTVGSFGRGEGELAQPAAVAVLAGGDMVVANMDADRLDRFGGAAGLPTCQGDSDCDGLSDAWEIANGLDPNDPTDALADADGDGLNAAEEFAWGSNPRSRDSDGDGYDDGEEIASGFNPADPDDHKPRVLAQGSWSEPGLVRLSASVHDPVAGRGACSTSWRQASGAPVALRGATTLSPSFVARRAGLYALEAVATCGGQAGVPKRVEVRVGNVPPVADGARVAVLPAGGRLQLTGLFSTDANADAIAHQWDQVLGPPVAASVANPTLTTRLQTPGLYVFRLGAKDPAGAEGEVEVPVVVLGAAPAPSARVVSPVVTQAGLPTALDATGSYRGAGATFAWTQIDGEELGEIQGSTSALASFVPPAPGRYVFEVALAEGGMRAPIARVEVYAAAAGGTLPVASASAPAVVAVDQPFTLSGSGSGGEELWFHWRQVGGPASGLTRGDDAAATAVAFSPGSLEYELFVGDGAVVGLPARVRVEARSQSKPIPVAVATAPRPAAVEGDLVLLDGRASTGAVRYRWTQVEGPWVVVEQGAVASFVPRAAGTYGFELEVDDGAVRSAPVRVEVVVSGNGTELSR